MGEFQKRDTAVVGILAQNMNKVRAYLEGESYPFPLLVDEKRVVVREYGVYVKANLESLNIARPTDFIVDADGIIKYIYMGYHQRDFPDDEELFGVLDEIRN
jgi:methyl-accepting chemotaxis protein